MFPTYLDNTEEKVTSKDSNVTTVTRTIMDACIGNICYN